MSTSSRGTPGRNSLFFRDFATPVSYKHSHEKISTHGKAAAVSALWRENFSTSNLPPPPISTLEDRSDFSPESGIRDYSISPEVKSDPRNSSPSFDGEFSTPKNMYEVSTSFSGNSKQLLQKNRQSPVVNSSWWSSVKTGDSMELDHKGQGSPVGSVVQPGTFLMLPPPREVARPELKKSLVAVENLDDEEWVTVFGFSPADTNLVLREFEKCGVVLKHIPGPREANWMHILYQNRSGAQKALRKNGMEINGLLIIGVKLVDPIQHQALNEGLSDPRRIAFTPESSNRISDTNGFKVSPYPYYLPTGSSSSQQNAGTIATPTKSLVSKVTDLMFGV